MIEDLKVSCPLYPSLRNNDGETTSLEGIKATCNAEDDLIHIMCEANETMLKTGDCL